MKERTRNNRLKPHSRQSTFHHQKFLRAGKISVFQEMQIKFFSYFLLYFPSWHPKIHFNPMKSVSCPFKIFTVFPSAILKEHGGNMYGNYWITAWTSDWPPEASTESAVGTQLKAIHLCDWKGWSLAPPLLDSIWGLSGTGEGSLWRLLFFEFSLVSPGHG